MVMEGWLLSLSYKGRYSGIGRGGGGGAVARWINKRVISKV